jgi:hypothetical protein
LPARARASRGDLIVAGHEWGVQTHDHIEEEIAESGQPHE